MWGAVGAVNVSPFVAPLMKIDGDSDAAKVSVHSGTGSALDLFDEGAKFGVPKDN